jgi:hypothetical protein
MAEKKKKVRSKPFTDDTTVPGQVINKPGGGGVGDELVAVFGPGEPKTEDIGYYFTTSQAKYNLFKETVTISIRTYTPLVVTTTDDFPVNHLLVDPKKRRGRHRSVSVPCYRVENLTLVDEV